MIIADERFQAAELERRSRAQFRADVFRGLRSSAKELPSKYFYDKRGSDLFELITETQEYYPTRTEMAIMDQHAPEMARRIGRNCLLIEYGSGSSIKTRLLLNCLPDVAGYVPVDVSGDFLRQTAQNLRKAYPATRIMPLCADFTKKIDLPEETGHAARRVVYFPGSTIGNFTTAEAVTLLRQAADLCGPGGGLLLGADLQKDPDVLNAAYNDKRGVTADFNRNILARINRELNGDFALKQFAHRAFYNSDEGRIEMHLVSRVKQLVSIDDVEFSFAKGETIRTEYSYKFTQEGLRELARQGGFATEQVWTDELQYFSVGLFRVA